MTDTQSPTLPALDPATVEARMGSNYPTPFADQVAGREKRPLGDALGLKNFGVNLVWVPPGTSSSQRHYHSRQDEFIYVLEGELVLVTDTGEQTLVPGMAAGFPSGSGDGDYPDIDLLVRFVDGKRLFVHKDGTSYRDGQKED